MGFREKVCKRIGEKPYYIVGLVLVCLFSVITVLNTEFNQMQSLGTLWDFVANHTGIFIFDLVYVSILFTAMLFLVHHTFWAALLVSGPLYILSVVDFMKYVASNTHFVISDLLMTFNAKDIAGLATFTITPELVFCAVVFVVYMALLWLFDIHIPMKKRVGSVLAAAVLVINALVIVSPTIAKVVFQMSGIQDRGIDSSFVINEEFRRNNFIASLVKNSEKEVRNNILMPEDYCREKILSYKLPAGAQYRPVLEPNVVVVMSESYCDIRRLKGMDSKGILQVPEGTYATFDRLAQEGKLLETVVPTFGGYTTRTEFELTMGLPVNSMNNLTVPHFKLKERQQLSVAEAFGGDGYRTYYLHPFSGTFYGRQDMLSTYGYDRLIFQEDGWPETMGEDGSDYEKFRRYIDDDQVFDRILKVLKNEEKPVYIHATTMQNHQPYSDENGTDQLVYYLRGVGHTDQALAEFTQQLRELDEPTVLLFVGDHYPFFVGEESLYNQLGINSYNCEELFRQPCLVWNNYGMPMAGLPQEPVSVFYLPHVLRRELHLQLRPWERILLGEMENKPVYTQPYQNTGRDDLLDELTYDIAVGEQYIKELS